MINIYVSSKLDSPDYRLKFSTTSTRYTKLHEGAVLDKKQGLTHCQIVVPRRHLHNFGPGQSLVLPEVVIRGQVSIIARRRHLKKTQ